MKIKLLVQDNYAILHHLGPINISILLRIPILKNNIFVKPIQEDLKLVYPAFELEQKTLLKSNISWFQKKEINTKNTIEVEDAELIKLMNLILSVYKTYFSLPNKFKFTLSPEKSNLKSNLICIIEAELCNYYLNKLDANCCDNQWEIIRKKAINWLFYGMLQNKY